MIPSLGRPGRGDEPKAVAPRPGVEPHLQRRQRGGVLLIVGMDCGQQRRVPPRVRKATSSSHAHREGLPSEHTRTATRPPDFDLRLFRDPVCPVDQLLCPDKGIADWTCPLRVFRNQGGPEQAVAFTAQQVPSRATLLLATPRLALPRVRRAC